MTTATRPLARRPLAWLVWHPHQKLWNWRLEAALRRIGRRAGVARALVGLLVNVDSLFLLARVTIARVRAFGLRDAWRLVAPSSRPVLYVDCGVHKHGEQIRRMHDWFGDRRALHLLGFEASATHCADAAANLADLPGLDLRQLALVGPDVTDRTVKLFTGARDGKADSLFAAPGASDYDLVPAARLSSLLETEYAASLAHDAVLLRMNIEGSEYDVIDDLVRRGLHGSIDGYFGMWDDVSKLDAAKDRRFRQMLRDAGITTVTFNDRDLDHPLRRFAIRLAVDAAIRRGERAKPTRAAT